MNKKEFCKKLYKKYKELRELTDLKSHDMKRGAPVKIKDLAVREVDEIKKVRAELKNYLDYLSNEELELEYVSKDCVIGRFAEEILGKRKIKQLKND